MPIKRKNTFIKKVRDISIAGSISLSVIASGGFMQSCGSSSQEYETVYTKGIRSYIQEIEPGEFKIMDEEVSADGKSMAHVTYLDGRTETLTLEEMKKLAAEENANSNIDSLSQELSNAGQEPDTSSQRQQRSGFGFGGLGTLLLLSNMGSMMGRSGAVAPNPGVYANKETFQKAQSNNTSFKNSAVRRPVSSSKGFFGKSGNSSTGRSFGG
ncbi:hypothetical protein RCC89_16310 [Cytophagaceae bacterium ABcell3]|nr:hypothetical protein RCC89_16310 [Cytophagaceae bacterium ABcell3]